MLIIILSESDAFQSLSMSEGLGAARWEKLGNCKEDFMMQNTF